GCPPPSAVRRDGTSGKRKALAAIGQQRFAALPEIPTLTESGIAGFEESLWFGFNAPAKTPSSIVERLSAETIRVLNLPEVKTQLAAQSIEALPGTSEQYRALIKRDTQKWAEVIRSAAVKIE